MADARDRPVEQVSGALGWAGARSVARGLAEAQRVEHRDRTSADREDVAQDAPDAGGGALEGLDRGGVVVRLDLERAHETVTDVHRAGVLAWTHDDLRALGGERAQQLLGVLVGAVLAPQQRVHRQLDLVRRAILVLADQLVLGARQAECERILDRGQRGCGALRHGRLLSEQRRASAHERAKPGRRHAQTCAPSTVKRIDSKILSPSVEPPVSASTACSGWGINPNTLPASLQTPAMSRSEPLKF